ncbi:PDZ domain-containing protein [Streptomyces sp. NA02950]|uniref:YlbL family protein n=1 Tax=Streptomyces sp. NA02950 TaxID=2742137 RepID=UPI00159133BE|nr:PDZ domain-containing protein [Streptomyces sp. NA02950]QKV92667.1 PDZ domain-containing protein [Streptomyces sp. NA02950]
MPRRTATMLASLLMLIALLCAGVLIPVPYAEMSPGPTYNTLGEHNGECVLQISGHKGCETTGGHLNMTTVRVTGSEYRMNLVEAVYGWLAHDDVVVPHDTLYPDDKTPDEVNQQNAEEFTQSQESAKVAALRALKKPVSSQVIVGVVRKGSPSQDRLHAGDVIKSVDGTPVHGPEDISKLVTKHKPGEKVVFSVIPAKAVAAAEKRGKKPSGQKRVTVTSTTAKDGRTIVGITPGLDYTFPFRIDIKLADVGGPSAGLMFALGIVDRLSPGDLTDGKFIAGTGTINEKGVVGPIGGIEMKTIGAREAGARYFLTPKENCAAAAKDVPGGLRLVKVHTIDDALKALKKIRQGDTDGLPACTTS